MKSNILTIMSKEFARFFTDRRMVIMTLMPAVLIYAVYSFMGATLASVFAPDENHKPNIYAVNAPDFFMQITQAGDVSVLQISPAEADTVRDRLAGKDENVDVLLVFPENFSILIDEYSTGDRTNPAPNVEIYYNSTVPNSHQAYYDCSAILDYYESSVVNLFDINRDTDNADLATAEEQSATVISMLMPMLLMIFLVSGSMGLALESITGEKERGTLATLLVSPLKRSELAIGKILSLAVLSFLSGAVTAGATILSIPNLMGGSSDAIDTGIYSMTDYALLAFVILTVLLVIVALLSIVSAFSKTVKEAGQATTPVMILVMVVGVSGMFGSSPTDPVYYAIPLYGSVQSMNGIFSLNYDVVNIVVACLSSLLYACLGGFALTKMFNSEKVMFSQ